MESSKPQVGDRVIVAAPMSWQRTGVVLETDYHPFGDEDAVKVRLTDCPDPDPKWFALCRVRKVVSGD